MIQEPLDTAHAHSFKNENEIRASSLCGCFYCCLTFAPSDVREWLTELSGGQRTAFCPRCGIDAVLGSASGYAITPDFLKQMQQRWFSEMTSVGEDFWPPFRADESSP